MSDFEKKMIAVCNNMINDRCGMYGTRNTIQYLLDNGFTREELLEMDFNGNEVNEAIEEYEEEN